MAGSIPHAHALARTLALRDADLAGRAAASFRGTTDVAEIEGLVELLLNRESSATACSAALRSLEHDTSPPVSDAVVRSLANPFPSIRIVAANEVVRRRLHDDAASELRRLIHTDTFWQVRRAAVWAIGGEPSDGKWDVTTRCSKSSTHRTISSAPRNATPRRRRRRRCC